MNIQKVYNALNLAEQGADRLLKTSKIDGSAFKAVYIEVVAQNGDRIRIQLGDAMWLVGAK